MTDITPTSTWPVGKSNISESTDLSSSGEDPLSHQSSYSLIRAARAALQEIGGLTQCTYPPARQPIGLLAPECHQQVTNSLKVLQLLRKLSPEDFEPGNRAGAIAPILQLELGSVEQLYAAIGTALTAQSPRLSDFAKAGVIRSIGLNAKGADSTAFEFLLHYLTSDSPAQAHAAALSLADVITPYSVPRLRSKLGKIRSASAKKFVEKTISESE